MSRTERATPVIHRPTTLGSALAVLLAAGSLVLVAGIPQLPAVGLTVVGLFVLGVGSHGDTSDRSRRLLAAVCGSGLVGLGLLAVLTAELATGIVTVIYPGLAGLVVLGLALLPVRRGWETALATAGVALVFVGVLAGGVAYTTSRLGLLVATVGIIAAWDAARHAITLGDQIGQQAATRQVELAHIAGTCLVGIVFVGLSELVWRLGITGLPLEALLLFLGAGIAFLLALYT